MDSSRVDGRGPGHSSSRASAASVDDKLFSKPMRFSMSHSVVPPVRLAWLKTTVALQTRRTGAPIINSVCAVGSALGVMAACISSHDARTDVARRCTGAQSIAWRTGRHARAATGPMAGRSV